MESGKSGVKVFLTPSQIEFLEQLKDYRINMTQLVPLFGLIFSKISCPEWRKIYENFEAEKKYKGKIPKFFGVDVYMFETYRRRTIYRLRLCLDKKVLLSDVDFIRLTIEALRFFLFSEDNYSL